MTLWHEVRNEDIFADTGEVTVRMWSACGNRYDMQWTMLSVHCHWYPANQKQIVVAEEVLQLVMEEQEV